MTRGFLSASVIGLTLATSLLAQDPFRVITRPTIPSQEVIDRLGLSFGWHVRVPLEEIRDSIFSIQVIPRGTGEAISTEIVVQTFKGLVYLFDGETGALRWSTPVGFGFGAMQPVAHNSQSIIVTRREFVFFLNRETGIQRVYTKVEGRRNFGIRLNSMPSAAPVANEELLVFTFPDRVTTFAIPDFDAIATARDKEPEILEQERLGSVQPLEYWTYYDPTMKLRNPAMIAGGQVAVTTPDGRVISLVAGETRERLRYEFRTLAGISVGMGHHGEFGYVGSQDSYLYAMNLENERLVWRYPSGGAVIRRPEVNDADVFVVSQDRGLARIHRFIGERYWLEETANRFLAAHYSKDAKKKFKLDRQNRVLAKYVYAADRFGRLLILDGDRGGILAQFDTSDWQMPVSNEWTDRIYLGNIDGQILCLHPRESRRPQINRTRPIPRAPGERDAKPKPPMEEKKDDGNAVGRLFRTPFSIDRAAAFCALDGESPGSFRMSSRLALSTDPLGNP